MRILVSTWPAHGHLLPMLPFVEAAQAAGHEVVVASGREGVTQARRRGFDVWDVAPSRADAEAAFRAVAPDLGALPEAELVPTIFGTMFGTGAALRAPHLVPMARQWRPDVVVHPVTELAGAVAARLTGARHVVHGLGPLPADAWQWVRPRFVDLCAQWDVPDLVEGILEVPYLDTCPPSLQPDAVGDFRNRRPLRPSPGDGHADDPLPWDDAALAGLPFDRTVHLTLGTMFHDRTHVLRTALDGLLDLPVNVLVSVGPGNDPDGLGPLPPQVLTAELAAHAAVLPRCTALVSQGGAGTIVAALAHGLPHLVLPQGADQFLNAATAERAGVALTLAPAQLTVGAVRDAVRRLLEEPGIRAAAHAVRTEIDRMPGPDDVVASLVDRR